MLDSGGQEVSRLLKLLGSLDQGLGCEYYGELWLIIRKASFANSFTEYKKL